MPIREEAVKPVRLRWFCGFKDCGGEMIAGQAIRTIDVDWQHHCNKCGREEWAKKSYPCVEYRNAKA